MNNSIDIFATKVSKLFFDDPVYGKKVIINRLVKLFINLNNFEYDFSLMDRLNDIFYQIESQMKIKDKHTQIEVFFLCLDNLENLVRFENLIGSVKEFSYAKLRSKVEKCQPFLKGDYQIDIPVNPNQRYLETLNVFNEITNCKKEVNITLLNIVYNKKRKAKKVKIPIEDLIASKNFWLDFSEKFKRSKKKALKKVEQIEKLIEEFK